MSSCDVADVYKPLNIHHAKILTETLTEVLAGRCETEMPSSIVQDDGSIEISIYYFRQPER